MTKYDTIEKEFHQIEDIVVEYYQIDKNDLLKSNKEEVVDARYCLISILCDKYQDSIIAKVSGLSKSVVNKIRNIVGNKNKSRSFYFDLNNVKSIAYNKINY